MKKFKLSKEQIKPLVQNSSACIATDKIVVDGYPVRFMYRETPDRKDDSGWRYMSGFEDDEYMDNADNHGIYAINTIANYDPSIIAFIESPIGSVFEKDINQEKFIAVTDWSPIDE